MAKGALAGSEIAETYWLRIWSNTYDADDGQKRDPTKDVNFYLGVYGFLAILTIIIDTLREASYSL